MSMTTERSLQKDSGRMIRVQYEDDSNMRAS